MLGITVVTIASVVLCLLGLSVALNYKGAPVRVATLVAGKSRVIHQRADRIWSVPILSLGIGVPLGLAVARLNADAGALVTATSAAIYIGVVMWLAWIYTPKQSRQFGPLFWSMRAAAVPAAAFFGYGGIIVLIEVVPTLR